MVFTLRFFFFSFSECSLFHNSSIFGSCIIHILITGVLSYRPVTSKVAFYIFIQQYEYFKHVIYPPFFFFFSECSLFHNSNAFGSCIIHILIAGVLKLKTNLAPKC